MVDAHGVLLRHADSPRVRWRTGACLTMPWLVLWVSLGVGGHTGAVGFRSAAYAKTGTPIVVSAALNLFKDY